MHEILHIIGICPDNMSHIDLLDLVFVNYQNNLNLNTMNYFITNFFKKI